MLRARLCRIASATLAAFNPPDSSQGLRGLKSRARRQSNALPLPPGREASRGGEILNLTAQEFILLEYLCRNPGRVVTRSMILDKVWGMRIQPDTNVVDVHIYRLRGKVDLQGRSPLIRTLRGVGYVLRDR